MRLARRPAVSDRARALIDASVPGETLQCLVRGHTKHVFTTLTLQSLSGEVDGTGRGLVQSLALDLRADVGEWDSLEPDTADVVEVLPVEPEPVAPDVGQPEPGARMDDLASMIDSVVEGAGSAAAQATESLVARMRRR